MLRIFLNILSLSNGDAEDAHLNDFCVCLSSPSGGWVEGERRRDVAIEAGSTTWLSIPSAWSARWIQNPSSPASWTTMIGKRWPVRARAFSWICAKRSSSPATSPPRSECFDILSPPPGDSDVISQIDRLSSSETKIAPRSVRIAVGVWGWSSATICMVASRVRVSNLTLPERRSLSTSPWDLEARCVVPARSSAHGLS